MTIHRGIWTMQRRELLKGTMAGLGAGFLKGASPEIAQARTTEPQPAKTPVAPSTLSIREFLSREAQRMTKAALADYTDAATFHRLLPGRRRQYLEMMGVWDLPAYAERTPLNTKVTGVINRPRYRIEKLYYESLPRLYVDANLYVPTGLTGKAPAILYTCGHEENQKVVYQTHARRFAELGFVCLLIETLQRGEVKGEHHPESRAGWFHCYSRGYTPGGIEMLNGIRGIDLLVGRPEVDPQRIGVTGLSGGGAYSWWIPAADERVKASATHCGTSTIASHIYDRTVDRNCDCMWWINTYGWDHADVGALVAPRAQLIGASRRDQYFHVTGAREVHRQLKGLYTMLGVPENLGYVEPVGQHGYDELARTTIFSWFMKHLQGKDIPPSQVGDIDEIPAHQESEDTLRVYVDGPPPDNRVPTIQDDFITLPEPPRLASAGQVAEHRQQVIAQLREKTFGAFPKNPPPLDVQVEYEWRFYEDGAGYRFAYTSEEGVRLHGFLLNLALNTPTPAPAVLMLRSPETFTGEGNGPDQSFLRTLHAPCAKLMVETRGTGDTAWAEGLNLHLRRASAWMGRTIASMRVYDTLRALEAVRQLPYVDGKRVALAGSGEMAVVALYAALLDGHVDSVILDAPPPTQNAPSQPDGRGPALEMLNCLRITDLPQVAGLLYPKELVFIGEVPISFGWTVELYDRLGAPGKLLRLRDLNGWRLA
jgi:cephalosporin-C deacetylase-like acetyl esterase